MRKLFTCFYIYFDRTPYHDLQELAKEVINEMFGGTYTGIENISWTDKPYKGFYGRFWRDTHNIDINCVLNSKDVNREVTNRPIPNCTVRIYTDSNTDTPFEVLTTDVNGRTPTDRTAKDYYVKYKDYIKNVVSSEIYSTWPTATIVANTLAIMSFTLNRVYTEWYHCVRKFVVAKSLFWMIW